MENKSLCMCHVALCREERTEGLHERLVVVGHKDLVSHEGEQRKDVDQSRADLAAGHRPQWDV